MPTQSVDVRVPPFAPAATAFSIARFYTDLAIVRLSVDPPVRLLPCKPGTRAEYDDDEVNTARNAVSEGQGMLVLIDWFLKPMNRSVETSPEAGELNPARENPSSRQ